MEDLFEVLIVVLIAIVGAVLKDKNKQNKQKKSVDRPTQAVASDTAPAKPIPKSPNLEKAFTALTELLEDDDLPDPDQPAAIRPAPVKVREQTSIEAETAMKQRAELIQTRIQESLSGESAVDDHGCIGGSMPEHTAEGETLAEHAVHEHNRAARLQSETAAVRAGDLRKPTAADLRKAIVMSEILDKPVSLRRRRI